MSTDVSLQTAAFSDDFVDLPGLNAHVSAALAARIEEVSGRARRGERAGARAFAVLGAAGGGKTHIFARLRHQAGLKATLILLRPFFGVSLTPRDVLATIVDQLCLPVRGGALTQLDVLSAYWLGDREDASFPSAAIDAVQALSPEERAARIERAVGDIVACVPEAAPAAHLARALLSLADHERTTRWAELAWLSGREPRKQDSAPLAEADVAHLLRIVSVVAAPVAPMVLTFDQLENLAGDDDARVLGYGNLVAELVDTVPSLTIAQLALTSEWMQYIEPRLTLPQKTRVASDVLMLESPDRAQREQLLRTWHGHLSPANGRGGRKRFPSPLSAEELEALLEAPGMTPRLLLAALSRAVAGKPAATPSAPPPSLRSGARFDAVWNEAYAATVAELAQKSAAGVAVDAAELAEGLGKRAFLRVGARESPTAPSASACSPKYARRAAQPRCSTSPERTTPRWAARSPGPPSSRRQARPWSCARSTWSCRPSGNRCRSVAPRSSACPMPAGCGSSATMLRGLLTLGRLMSRARANRLRVGDSPEVLSESDARARLRDHDPPQLWRPAAAIVTWLSDVPRERASVPEPAPSVPPAAQKSAPSSAPAPSFREWVRLGGQLGKDAVSRYVDRLRKLRRD